MYGKGVITLEAQEASRHAPSMGGKGDGTKYKRSVDKALSSLWNDMFPKVLSTEATKEEALAFRKRMERARAKKTT